MSDGNSEKNCVLYFNHNTGHLARLVVSAYSLRQVYSGPIVVADSGQSAAAKEILQQLAADIPNLTVVHDAPWVQLRRHSAYVSKSHVWQVPERLGYAAALLLDADTLPVRDPTPLLQLAEAHGLVVTRFYNWVTTGSIYLGRLRQWGPVEWRGHRVDHFLKPVISKSSPAINTGVVAWRSPCGRENEKSVLHDWAELSRAGWRCSFTDELAMQILISMHPHYLAGCHWNQSPLYNAGNGRNELVDDTCIWHFHGDKHCRWPESLPLWWPAWKRVSERNIAGVNVWAESSGDGALARRLSDLREGVYEETDWLGGNAERATESK